MLKKSNILALVGGGTYPKFSRNKITIYDDHGGLILRQIRFNSNVISVKIRTDSIIGVIEDKIYIININTLATIDIIDIDKINYSTYSISNFNNELFLAFVEPKNKGNVQIEKYIISSKKTNKDEKRIINAHESNVIFLVLNNEGTLLATASEKGQYIRIFNISNGNLLAELKRGKKSKISSLTFEFKSEIIGYSSEAGKTYIYNINELKKLINNKKENEKSTENNKKELLKKSSESFKIKEKPFSKFKFEEGKNIIGFIEPKSVVILTSEAKFYKASYNVKSGKKCILLEESLIKIDNK